MFALMRFVSLACMLSAAGTMSAAPVAAPLSRHELDFGGGSFMAHDLIAGYVDKSPAKRAAGKCLAVYSVYFDH